MSAEQASGLGLARGKLDHSAGRPTCVWSAESGDANVVETLSIRFQSSSGLEMIVDSCHTRDDCGSSAADTINGYPVIRADGALESKYGMCRMFVGIAEDKAFLVTDGRMTTPQQDGPRCERADRATAFAIDTMIGAG